MTGERSGVRRADGREAAGNVNTRGLTPLGSPLVALGSGTVTRSARAFRRTDYSDRTATPNLPPPYVAPSVTSRSERTAPIAGSNST